MKQFILTYILGISIIGVVLHQDPKLEATVLSEGVKSTQISALLAIWKMVKVLLTLFHP